MRRLTPPGRRGFSGIPAALLGLLSFGCLLSPANAQQHTPYTAMEGPFGRESDLFLQARVTAEPMSTVVSSVLTSGKPLTTPQIDQVKALGLEVTDNFAFINGIAVQGTLNAIVSAAELEFITGVTENVPTLKSDDFTLRSSLAGAAYQAYGLTGGGVRVAVLDSGVRASNTDLKNRVVASVSMVPGETNADDTNGHGTHVAGIIAGSGKLTTGNSYSRTIYGIARAADIVNVRVLNAEGEGKVSSVLRGIEWVINNRSKYNIRVMNLSLGHPVGASYTRDPLCLAVERAWKAGIVVVVAAGNSGRAHSGIDSARDNEGYGTAYGSIESPGNSPYAITVGAMKETDSNRANDRVATYSSRGPSRVDFVLKPDIMAPGNRVISLNVANETLDKAYAATNRIPYTYYQKNGSSALSPVFFKLSGTSMAAGVVSGAAAMMLQANTSLTPDAVKARLMLTADKWTHSDGTADACTFGAGYLNVAAALNAALTPQMYALSPCLYREAGGTVAISVDNAIWGSNALWGCGITQLNAIWGSHALWGTNAIWGSSTLSTSNALWGNALWTDNAIWGVSTTQSTAILTGGE